MQRARERENEIAKPITVFFLLKSISFIANNVFKKLNTFLSIHTLLP